MKIRIIKEDITAIKGESLIIPLFEEKEKRPTFFKIIDKKLNNAINNLIKKGYFGSKLHEIYLLPTYGKIGAENVLLVGLGKKKEFFLQNIFQILGTAGLYIKKMKFKNTIFPIYEPFLSYLPKKDLVKIFTQELFYAKYSYNKYKSEKEKDGLE